MTDVSVIMIAAPSLMPGTYCVVDYGRTAVFVADGGATVDEGSAMKSEMWGRRYTCPRARSRLSGSPIPRLRTPR